MIDHDTFVRVHHVPMTGGIHPEEAEGSGRDVLEALGIFFRKYHQSCVLHGPWSASKLFLGAQRMRAIPAIIDVVCTAAELEHVVVNEGFQFDREEQLFVCYQGPVVFRLDGQKIQDWDLDERYFSDAVHFSLNGTVIPVAAAEYTIALMLRHAYHAGEQLDGDAVRDCVALLAAPFVREGIRSLSLDRLSDLTLHMAGYRALAMLDQILEGVLFLQQHGVQEKTAAWIQAWRKELGALVASQA